MDEMKLNRRERARLEEEKKNRKTRQRYILMGVIVLILAALVIIVNSRLFTNGFTALKVGDTKYTLADVNYQYQSSYQQVYQTYGSYGLIDTSTPLDKQSSPFDPDGGTWADYFKSAAEQNLIQMTAYYNDAVAHGYTSLTEEEAAQIDSVLDSYRNIYPLYTATLDAFLSVNFGSGNNEKTVRANLAKELIVNRYLNDLFNGYTFTDAEKDAYYTEHAAELNTVKYYPVFLSGAADEEAGLDQEAAMALARENAATIVTSSEGAEDLFLAAAYEMTDTEPTAATLSESSFLSRFEGDVSEADLVEGTVFTHETDTGVYAVYVLDREENDYRCVSVRHILIQAEDTDGDGVYSDEEKQAAYDAVVAIQEEWEAGEATEESFAALAREKSEDAGSAEEGGLYENIFKGQMVSEFNDFCFADHQSGDTGIVWGETSGYAGYHLIYFVSADGDLYSRVLANNELASQAYNDYVTELVESYSAQRGIMWHYVGKNI